MTGDPRLGRPFGRGAAGRRALALLVGLSAAGALPAPAHAGVPATWGPEERLTTTTTDSETGLTHAAVAPDGAGRVHVVWAEQDGPRGNYQIYTRRRVGGVWQAATLVVPFRPEGVGSLLGAKFPALVCDRDDTLHLAWHDYRVAGINNCEIFYKNCAADAAWDTNAAAEVRLTTTNHVVTNGDNGYVPALAVDRDGVTHCAWYDFRGDGVHAEILWKARVNGGWDLTPGDAADLNVSATAGDSELPAVALDPWNDLHVAWQDDTSGNNRIFYTRRAAATGQVEPPIELTTHAQAAVSVALAADGVGRVYAAWVDSRDGARRIYTRRREPDGQWTPERPATPAGLNADEPALAVDRFGQPNLVWHDTRISATNREIFLQTAAAGGEWDPTGVSDARISNGAGNSTRPSIAADAAGNLFVVWKDRRDGNHEIYFRGGVAGAPVSGVGSERPPEPTRRAPRVTAWPNPFRGDVRLESDDAATFEIFDAQGRLVAAAPGVPALAFHWDGRTREGRPAPAGLYYARVRGNRGVAGATLVRVR